MKKIDEDIKYFVEVANQFDFNGKSFLITGATGMIGSILVNCLKNITEESKIYVLGFDYDDSVKKYGKTRMNLCSFDRLNSIKKDVDYIIHLASPTNPQFLKNNPVETISFIIDSTKAILDFANSHHSKVLYASSMEAYGEVFDEEIRHENDLGYVSLINTRSSYPEAKRLSELLCFSYSKEFKTNVCVARLAQTFGAGTSMSDPRVFGYFGRCVVNEEDIVLKTKGDTYGNYCYIMDTLVAFLYVLSKGFSGETYNIVGDNCRSTIIDLANLVANEIANGKIKVKFDLNNNSQFPNPTKLNMANDKIKSLGWSPKYSLKKMFQRMIESWSECF